MEDIRIWRGSFASAWWVFAIIACATIAVYFQTFDAPMHFDDEPSITNNSTIQHFGTALWPPMNTTVSGRPILNLSLAINYAISGTAVWSYHALNLAIHILAGFTLFGIVRRTASSWEGQKATGIGFCVALLWALHPLQTESVTYIIQRAESLMGLLYLLTLYCFIRGADASTTKPTLWYALSIGACLLGMATKEVMVSVPLIVFLYDRTFIVGGFSEAWQRRRWVYIMLAATWLIVPFLVFSTHGRAGTAGFGSGVPLWGYFITQLPAVVTYLRLCFWPYPLIFDYGSAIVAPALWILPYALFVIGLATTTLWAIGKKPAIGFLGVCFFAILAPSSSIVPVATETMAEHRMYLPLATVVTLVVFQMFKLLRGGALPACMILAVALGFVTVRRNQAYLSEFTIWRDTIYKNPENPRAHINLGIALEKIPGRTNDAIAEFKEVLRLKPDSPEAHNNLGTALDKIPGRTEDAIAEFKEALKLKPDYPEALNNLGAEWNKIPGRTNEAVAAYESALRLNPDFPEAHFNLGNVWKKIPYRLNDAVVEYKEALRLEPSFVEAHENLANVLVRIPGRMNDAIAQYQDVLRLKPDYPEGHNNLGNALTNLPGRMNEAVAEYKEALRLKPDYPEAHYNLGNALLRLPGRIDDAIEQYEASLRLFPKFAAAQYKLALVLSKIPGRSDEAKLHLETILQVNPEDGRAKELLRSIRESKK